MTLSLVCGGECGIVGAGIAGTLANQHWSSSVAAAIETSIVRTGAKSIAVAPAGNAFSSVKRTPAGTPTIVYVRMYFRLTSVAPSTNMQIISVGGPTNTHYVRVTPGGVLGLASGSVVQAGPTLLANTWYGVEVEFNCAANPNTARWRTWDAAGGWVSRTDASGAIAAATFNGIWLGAWNITTGLTIYMDDILIGEGTTPGEDYSASVSKGGQVKIYRPNADGTHSFTAGDFGYNGAGADVATSATDVNTYLDESDQQSLADFIRQKVIRTTGYVEVAFEDEATLTPRAVAVTSTHHASSTATNQQSVKVSDDAFTSTTTVWSNDDVSDTTAHYRHKVLPTKPSGGAWTTAALNAMAARLGYSGDVTDIPYWDSISLEVEFTDPTVVTRQPPAGVLTASGPVATGRAIAKPTSGLSTASGPAPTGRGVAKPAAGLATLSGVAPTVREVAKPAAGLTTVSAPAPKGREQAHPAVGLATLSSPVPIGRQVARPPAGVLTLTAGGPAIRWVARPGAGLAVLSAPAPHAGQIARVPAGVLTLIAPVPLAGSPLPRHFGVVIAARATPGATLTARQPAATVAGRAKPTAEVLP